MIVDKAKDQRFFLAELKEGAQVAQVKCDVRGSTVGYPMFFKRDDVDSHESIRCRQIRYFGRETPEQHDGSALMSARM